MTQSQYLDLRKHSIHFAHRYGETIKRELVVSCARIGGFGVERGAIDDSVEWTVMWMKMPQNT